jgi:hypothetical protein
MMCTVLAHFPLLKDYITLTKLVYIMFFTLATYCDLKCSPSGQLYKIHEKYCNQIYKDIND